MSTKKKYVNEDIDGYKEENQSPLAPAWLFSGKQNEGKVLKGGPNGFVVWGSGGSGGTTDYDKLDNKPQLNGTELIGNTILTYNNLTNKPQLNGVELAGNITFPYVKTASISGNTLTLALIDSNQQETSLNFEIDIEPIKNAVLAEIANDYYKKDVIDSKLANINNQISQLRINLTSLINEKTSTLESLINQKTSPEEHYLKNKSQLIEGENMTLIMNDNQQTITFNATNAPEPPEPTADGIYSFNTTKKIYHKYDLSTIFATSGDIKYCEGDQYNNFPNEYDKTIARQIFNEPIFFIFKNIDETTTNNMFINCLANCQEFNQSLDFSDVSNLTVIGQGFLYGCVKFNSTITFKPNKIISIGNDFMFGCEKFNNNLNNLFTPALQEIRKNFLMDCHEFNQNLDFSNITCNGESGYNKIMLIGFMSNCFNFAQGKIIMGNKTTSIFKQSGYNSDMIQGMLGSCSAIDTSEAPCYQIGFHFEGTQISKTILDSFVISTTDGNTVNVFQNNNEGPYYKKIVVNGVNE